eukprot:8608437-Pyramimonas_sp.AAC.1
MVDHRIDRRVRSARSGRPTFDRQMAVRRIGASTGLISPADVRSGDDPSYDRHGRSIDRSTNRSIAQRRG